MTLLVKPHAPDDQGVVLDITPDSAGWEYVGFRVSRLRRGQSCEGAAVRRETCIVILAGRVRLHVNGKDLGLLGERDSVFDGPAWSAYVPADSEYRVEAETDCEVAFCSAPAEPGGEPAIIGPDASILEIRGTGTNERRVRNILDDTSEVAQSLLVVEVITPGGHWSSYPPHKHDQDAYPDETFLEETYYHRLSPPQGFAFQRVYTDDRAIDETMSVEDGSVVMVPRGYHPVGAPHGYDLYYLNVMAGPRKNWIFRNDPDHEWIIRKKG